MTPLNFSNNRIYTALMSIATLLLGFLFFVYVVYAINLIQFPFDYDQGEGFELVDTILFSEGKFPYQDTEQYPFYSSNYPPLFHILAVPFVWLFGNAYWYGRLLGFVSTLITAGAIAYAVYRDGEQKRWLALLSGLAFLASNFVYHIGPLVRQHITMVMFETLAIVILTKAFPRKDKKWTAIGLLLIILAGYTKQLAAITAIAVLLWMFLRNPRRAIGWGILFAGTGIGIFIGLIIATDGQWWIQTIVANVNQFFPFQAIDLFKLWLRLHGFLLIPATIFAIYELYFDRLSLYTVWFVIASILGGIGSGAWGAGDSYFTTSIAGMCILSGLFFSRTIAQNWHFPFRLSVRTQHAALLHLLIPVLYIGYALAVFHMPTQGILFKQIADIFRIQPNVYGNFYDSATYDVEGYANIGYLVTQADKDAGNQIVDLIQATNQPVLSEEAGFSLVAGRDVITNPTQLLNLWRAGLYDGEELLALINNQEFGLIILRAQFYPTPILEAIGQSYERTQTIHMNRFDYLLFRPISN